MKKLKKKGMVAFLLSITITLFSFNTASPQAGIDVNAKTKAIFIYNFSKYVEWPQSALSENFRIGILGEYPNLLKELNNMASTKKRGFQSFEITNFSAVDQINQCQILYVDKNKSEEIENIIKKLNGTSTLLVTDKEGFALKGAAINLLYNQNKQKMEINTTTIEKYNLKVSSQLLALAIVVN
ncbi:YfiR family protein [Fulvivirgaceae bacterium BMA10]|uniref:YfiR family protein n=1 Tax=Splendidivirga corallicola TaxID=3051826 RepID=A0ABT8KJB2_9BACT|nr:YfiR family protein [Fulvivirgaceae bacterium BMA10]